MNGHEDGPVPARTWDMFAAVHPDGRWYALYDHPRAVEMHAGPGVPPIPVTLVEDDNGDHMGWVAANEPDRLIMVQHVRLFNMQFPYGHRAEVESGRGTAHRVTITRKG